MDSHAVMLGAVFLLAGLLYGGSVRSPLVYEDWQIPYRGPIAWSSLTIPGRGLTTISQRITIGNRRVAHGVNVGLHLAVGALVALLAYQFAGPMAAVVASAIHLVQPLNSEAVLYVTGRAELWLALFTVGACLFALSRRWLLVGLCLVLAALTKEIGLMAAPLVVLTLFCAGRRMQWTWMLAVPVLCMPLWPRLVSLATTPARVGGLFMSWPEFVVRQNGLMWKLAALWVWPDGFTIDHDAWALSAGWLAFSAIATGAMLIMAVWALPRCPVMTWSLGWVLLALAPRVLIGSSEFISERQMYLPLVGVSVGVGAHISRRVSPGRFDRGRVSWLRA
jgi:hypothetical protein